MHAAPMYIAETSPSEIRGTLVSLKEALIVVGTLLGYLIGWWEIDSVGGWRFMFGFSALIAAVMGLGMWWLPPCPRWLLLRAVKGNEEEGWDLKKQASIAHKKLRGNHCSTETAEFETRETWRVLKAACEGGDMNVSFIELFQGVNLKALIVGGGLVFFQQYTGQPSVLYYAAPILQNAGFSAASDATQLSVLLGFYKLIMTIIAVLYVDKLGRRPLLIGGATG
uniref:Major facilitator superfamily (MFS) profile domain-containing protein n=1 Tax=Physcomitrium patens TaxID=3218 RepID=A0A7I3YWM5_PHYPA